MVEKIKASYSDGVAKDNRIIRPVDIDRLVDDINAEFATLTTENILEANPETDTAFTFNAGVSNENGEIKPYKSYVAMLEQSGNTAAPTVVALLENNLSAPIVWTRVGVGAYEGTLTGAFTANKTALFINMPPQEIGSEVIVSFQKTNANVIYIDVFEADGSTPSEGFKATVEVRVYN